MKTVTAACLFFLVTGCATITATGLNSSRTESEQFHNAIEQFFKKTDATPLKAYIKQYPDSLFVNDAKSLLQLYTSNLSDQKKLKTCDQQADASKQEIEKLQADIERLTRLHLEMGRNNP
ncbi:MAG: hypothetical protein IBX47_03120 [Desulfuromonadales bacterium]|nr:hypothetical protein [Desulfuromonadales bacterium]